MTDRIDHFYAEFGQRVRAARLDVGMTQAVLGASVGLTRGSVANLEAGRQRIPLHVLIELGRALRLPPAELLPIEEPGPSFDYNHLDAQLDNLSADDQDFIRTVVEAAVAGTPT